MRYYYQKRPKYNAHKVTIDGITFDSMKEARRWKQLSELERNGVISDLQRQVRYELVPEQREPDTVGPRGGKRRGRVLEKAAYYIADFTYHEKGRFVVEDVKGIRTDLYRLKRKIMLYKYGIKIRET